jgi:hypothetical protein
MPGSRRGHEPCHGRARGREEVGRATPGGQAMLRAPHRAAAQAGHAEPPRWLAASGRRAGRPRRAAASRAGEPGRAAGWDTPGRRADPRERPAGGRPWAPQRETRAREGEPRHAGRGATAARMAC